MWNISWASSAPTPGSTIPTSRAARIGCCCCRKTRICPPAVLRAQLDRLIAVSGLGNVELAVIPFSTEVPKAPTHGFWIFDDTLVLVETVNAELAIRDPDDVALYERLFEMYWDVADLGEDATRVITQVAVELHDH